jgi:hypothetical protein
MTSRRGMIGAVSRNRLPWLVAVPLMVAGSVSAHELGYWLVTPDATARARVLAESGHGYFEHLPLVLGVLAALLIAGLTLRVSRSLRAGTGGPPAWLFFVLPPLGFAVQEHLERLLHSGALPFDAALDPTFLVGLSLQLPFALAALAVARALVAGAERLGAALASRPPTPDARPVAVPSPSRALELPRIAVLALGYAERGPPPLAG